MGASRPFQGAPGPSRGLQAAPGASRDAQTSTVVWARLKCGMVRLGWTRAHTLAGGGGGWGVARLGWSARGSRGVSKGI